MTKAQKAAFEWLCEHNGTGVFDKHGVLLAGGERAPFMRSTWNALIRDGYCEKVINRRLTVKVLQ